MKDEVKDCVKETDLCRINDLSLSFDITEPRLNAKVFWPGKRAFILTGTQLHRFLFSLRSLLNRELFTNESYRCREA